MEGLRGKEVVVRRPTSRERDRSAGIPGHEGRGPDGDRAGLGAYGRGRTHGGRGGIERGQDADDEVDGALGERVDELDGLARGRELFRGDGSVLLPDVPEAITLGPPEYGRGRELKAVGVLARDPDGFGADVVAEVQVARPGRRTEGGGDRLVLLGREATVHLGPRA